MTASGVEKRVNRSEYDVDVHGRDVLAAPGVHTRKRVRSKVREAERQTLELDDGSQGVRRFNKTGNARQQLVFGIIDRVGQDEQDACTSGVNALDIARTAAVLGNKPELHRRVCAVNVDDVIDPERERFTWLNAECPLALLRLARVRLDRKLAASTKEGHGQEQHEGEVSHTGLYTQSRTSHGARVPVRLNLRDGRFTDGCEWCTFHYGLE